MPAQAGTAYVDFVGDFSTLHKQVGAAVAPLTSKFGKLGGAAATGIGAITVAAGAAGVALYKIGQDFDDAYDTIQSQTGATGKDLGKLKKDFQEVVKDVPSDFDSASKAVAGLNQRLDITGAPLRRLSKQLLELSRITETDVGDNVQSVTRLFGDWSVKTKNQEKVLDGLFRLSQKTGATVGDLADSMVQFGAPLRNLGFDMDFAAAMFANFEKTGVNTTTLLSGLRLSVANLAAPTEELGAKLKQLGIDAKDPERAIAEVFEAITKLNDTAGKNLAMEVFGRRAGSDVADAVRTGRFELDELIKTFEGGEGTILDTARATRDAAEQFQLLKNRVAVAIEPVALRTFELAGEAMKEINRLLAGEQPSNEFGRALRDIAGAIQLLGQWTARFVDIGGLDNIRELLRVLSAVARGDIAEAWRGIRNIFINALDDMLGAVSTFLDGIGKIPDGIPGLSSIGDGATEASDAIDSARESLRGLKGTTDGADKQLGSFADTWKKVRKAANDHGRGMSGDAKKHAKDVWDGWDEKLRALVKDGSTQGDHFKKAVSGSYQDMQKISQKAADELMAHTNEILKGMGIDPVGFSTKKKKGGGGDTTGDTTGQGGGGGGGSWATGGIVQFGAPGDVGHDTIAARIGKQDVRVAPGEVAAVFNRHQLPIVNARLADMGGLPGFFNTVDTPHYMAQGGVLPFAAGGLQPGIARLVSFAQDKLGLSVTSGLRPGDSDSFHGSGEAVDLAPPSMKTTEAIFAAFKDQLEELFYDPWGGWDSGQMIGAIGGHLDHIHAAIAGSGSGGALGDFAAVGAAAAGAAAPQLAQMILNGPPGALTSMGQGAIDQVHKAAQSYLDKHAGSASAGSAGSVANGPLKEMARAMVLQAWDGGQWPPFDELVTRESAWNPEAVNSDSGAAGLAQALPASKYPPGAWPYKGVESAKLQLGWMVDYVKERYGDPAGAISWHDSHNWYAKGGLLGGMAEGGLMGSIFKKVHKGKPIKKLLDKVKKMGLDPKLQEKLTNLTGRAAEFEDLAGRAASLSAEDDAGNVIQGLSLGPSGEWQTEGEWLTKALDKLFELRNVLARAHEQIEAAKAEMTKMLEAAQKRLEKLRESRKGLVEQLRGAKGGDKKGIQKQIDDLDAERTHIRDNVLGVLKDQSGTLTTNDTDILDTLTDVQGISSPLTDMTGQALPPIGTLGGRIFDAQFRLKELGEPTSPTLSGGDGDSLTADLLAGLVSDWQKRFVVSQAQYPVFQDFFGSMPPFGGSFAEGGSVPGPSGAPRTIIAHGGEVVGQEGPPISPSFEVHVHDGAVNSDYIEVRARKAVSADLSKSRRRVNV